MPRARAVQQGQARAVQQVQARAVQLQARTRVDPPSQMMPYAPSSRRHWRESTIQSLFYGFMIVYHYVSSVFMMVLSFLFYLGAELWADLFSGVAEMSVEFYVAVAPHLQVTLEYLELLNDVLREEAAAEARDEAEAEAPAEEEPRQQAG
ncbi:unnamed protein product, partial [Mesorhabditis spiculigera]